MSEGSTPPEYIQGYLLFCGVVEDDLEINKPDRSKWTESSQALGNKIVRLLLI